MQTEHLVESYKFWDIATLWARERLTHEIIVARELAEGVIKEGLRFNSVDPKWFDSQHELRAYPYVGYAATPKDSPVILDAAVLEHMLAMVRQGIEPQQAILQKEFAYQIDFRRWLVRTGRPLARFWFAEHEYT